MYISVNKSKGYAFFLAIIPIIMMYRVPGLEISSSTILIAIGMIYALLVTVTCKNRITWDVLFPFVLYFTYVMTKSGIQSIAFIFAILCHLLAVSTGSIDTTKLRKYIETISVIATICLITQVAFRVLTGIHIPMIISDCILESMNDYVNVIKTGYNAVDNMYRPSAFFLEPAGFSQYCIIGLGSALFSDKVNFRKAVLISVGIFLTTSGMGFVMVFGMWGWWYIANNTKESVFKKIMKTILALLVIVVVVATLSRISFFASIISRFMNNGNGQYNAINGRLLRWDQYFGGLKWKDLLYGFREESLPKVYFTGFMKNLYAYGIIGCGLLFWALFNLAIKSVRLARGLIILFLLMLFFSNQTSFVSLTFYFGTYLALSINEKTDSNNCIIAHT